MRRRGWPGWWTGRRCRVRVRIRCPRRSRPESSSCAAHPGWGPRTIGHWLEREGIAPLPGRSSIHRCLVRHGLITPEDRKRKKVDYVRWERARWMDLWQMDIVGGVRLVDACAGPVHSGHVGSGRWVTLTIRRRRSAAAHSGPLNPVCEPGWVRPGRRRRRRARRPRCPRSSSPSGIAMVSSPPP